MVTVEARKGPFKIIDVYFPEAHEIDAIEHRLALNQFVHLRQVPLPLSFSRNLVNEALTPAMVIDLSRGTTELFARMSRTTRYEIGKIDRQRARVQVRRNDPRSWDDFQTIYNAFAGANRHTTEISRYHLDVLKPFTDVLVLYLDQRPVCAHLMLRDEKIKRVAGIWSASIRLADVRAANLSSSLNRWLHWYEMRMCKSEGMLVYDLGGTVSENLTKFKLSLGGSRVMQHEYILARTPARLAFRLFRFLQRMRTGKRPASATGAPPNRKREHGAMGLPEMVGD